MRIDISELELAIEKILTHIKSKGIKFVEIEEDFYWNISMNEKYDNYSEPKHLDVGQLTDDWQELKNIADGQSEPNVYSLVWVSTIFRILGEKLNE